MLIASVLVSKVNEERLIGSTLDDLYNSSNHRRRFDDETNRCYQTVDVIRHHREQKRSSRRLKRNGVSRPAKLWPDGRIPYSISPNYSAHERALLARAVKKYHESTCLRFVPRNQQEVDYLFVGKVDG